MNKKKLIILAIIISKAFLFSTFAENLNTSCFKKAKKLGIEASQYMQKNKFKEAIDRWEKTLTLCFKCFPIEKITKEDKNQLVTLYLSTYLGLGGSYLSLGQKQQAIDTYEEAAKKLPKKAWIFYDSIATIYTSQRKYQEAINICKNTLQSFPESNTTYHLLGRIYYNLSEYVKAKKYLKKALDISIQKGDNNIAQETESILKIIP